MPSAAQALQKALHDTIASDPALVGLIGPAGVHDEPPRGSPFPFVAIGDAETRPFDRWAQALEHLVTLHAWSRAGGARQAQAMLAALIDALEDREITLEGHRLANLALDFTTLRREPDGQTLHGVARFRAVTEPLA